MSLWNDAGHVHRKTSRQEPALGAKSSEWTRCPCCRTDEGREEVAETGHGIGVWPEAIYIFVELNPKVNSSKSSPWSLPPRSRDALQHSVATGS